MRRPSRPDVGDGAAGVGLRSEAPTGAPAQEGGRSAVYGALGGPFKLAGGMVHHRHTAYRAAKRVLDVVVCAPALLLVTPLLLVVAILIKAGDREAPVLFRQRRTGYGGRKFELLKFRTM